MNHDLDQALTDMRELEEQLACDEEEFILLTAALARTCERGSKQERRKKVEAFRATAKESDAICQRYIVAVARVVTTCLSEVDAARAERTPVANERSANYLHRGAVALACGAEHMCPEVVCELLQTMAAALREAAPRPHNVAVEVLERWAGDQERVQQLDEAVREARSTLGLEDRPSLPAGADSGP